jgi:hypothetical protein
MGIDIPIPAPLNALAKTVFPICLTKPFPTKPVFFFSDFLSATRKSDINDIRTRRKLIPKRVL